MDLVSVSAPSRKRTAAVVLLVAIVWSAAACSTPEEPRERPSANTTRVPTAGSADLLSITFDSAPEPGSPITELQADVGAATLSRSQLGSGEVLAAPDERAGRAAAFPQEADVASGNLAVLRVTLAGPDTLAVGTENFDFGVDVNYPAGSAGDATGDDGDNLLQRGLFGDGGQYKLQVDSGRPACRIAGSQGEVLVKADLRLDDDQWYRLLCQRDSGEVTLFVAELDGTTPQGDLKWTSWTERDTSGSIDPGEPAEPVSVGGKLNPEGEIVKDAPDQFSGVLDNLIVRRLP